MAALVALVEDRVCMRLGADRLYLLSLGTLPDDHVHFHLVPVMGDPLPGLAALERGPLDIPRAEALRKLAFHELSSFRPLIDDEPAGISRTTERATQALRWISPYRWGFLPLFNRLSQHRFERSIVAEVYTLGWFAVVVAALVAGWLIESQFVALCLAFVAVVRIIDILSTQGGIILFESQGQGFVGVRSVARTVLLGLINLAEVVVGYAVIATTVERWSSDTAFSPPIANAAEAVLWAAGPLGASPASPVSTVATVVSLASIATLGFLVILVVGVFVSNLSARLEGR